MAQATPSPPVEDTIAEDVPYLAPRTSLWILPIPKRCRYDPSTPFPFGYPMNFLFAFASTFTVANLYYSQPILAALSDHFGVDYNEISLVPTLTQAGYAIGIAFISPLGDLVRRRSLVLLLIFLTTLLSIGLATTSSLQVFEALSFIIAALTVTPQIMIPLTADLAREDRRASAIAITLSGLMLGVLVARVISGIITNYASYQYVYWMSVGLQAFIFILLYLLLPDFPRKTRNVSYFQMLWSMLVYLVTYPVLVQCCIIGFLSSACFTNWWTTLSFLLADPPYSFNPLEIGLFGLVGLLGVLTAPFTGRLIDYLVPWLAQVVAMSLQITFQVIAVAAANRSVGAVVVVCWGLDLGLQMGQVANSSRVYGLKPEARARMNACYIIALFLGQTIGSISGAHLYTGHGWVAASSLSLGFMGLAMLVLFARGPHSKKWVGWDGGSRMRKERKVVEKDAEVGAGSVETEGSGEGAAGVNDKKVEEAEQEQGDVKEAVPQEVELRQLDRT